MLSNVYKAWAAAGDRVPFLTFFLLHDIPSQQCDDLTKYYGLPNNESFRAYLCTLGLRKADGKPRLAWSAFVEGASELKGQR
jgi:hypothetical protein